MNILEIEGLRKSYRTPESSIQTVVDIASFSVPVGSQIALYGISGTGKTTFLNLIAGILRPDAGKILLDGWDMASHGESARDAMRAKTVGYIFQTFNLLQGYTALENVTLAMMFGSGPDMDFARRLLDRVGLQDRRSYLPRQLSAGQQQRVAIARARSRSRLPVGSSASTSFGRFASAREAIALIRGLCAENGASLLIVSHDLEILRQFDTKISLADINRGGSAA